MNRHSFLARALRWTLASGVVLSCGECATAPSQGGAGGSAGSNIGDGPGPLVDASDDARGSAGGADASQDGNSADGDLDGSGASDRASTADGAGMADRGAISDHVATVDVADAARRNPFAAQPDTSEGLTNVSADLDALLEHGALRDACAAWQSDPTNRRRKLLCGKSMFFYEGFGTIGVPKPLMTWLMTSFPIEVGPGFEKLGLFTDPSSADKLPLGFASGKPFGPSNVETEAFTCASCHLARLPDGRYAVGAPNYAFRYGAMNLMVAVLPSLSLPGADPAAHDPAAIAVIQAQRDRMAQDPSIGLALLAAVAPLLGSMAPTLTAANERHYATWRAGTMDAFIQPLPLDDRVHTVAKIGAIWGIPSAEERAREGLSTAMISWAGGTASLYNFARGFVALGGGDRAAWTDARLEPFVEYIESLRAPANPAPPAESSVTMGGDLFAARGCLGCHDGPRGSGRTLYAYAEVGTDDAMMRFADPDLTGQPCCGIQFEPGDRVTHRIKSPRLVGLWAMQRFLHNGALDSLDQLLCLQPRPSTAEVAYGSQGHVYGCDAPENERRAIIDYLRSH
jgi:hypothetical protein